MAHTDEPKVIQIPCLVITKLACRTRYTTVTAYRRLVAKASLGSHGVGIEVGRYILFPEFYKLNNKADIIHAEMKGECFFITCTFFRMLF